jgi:hypothetical protein
MNMEKRRAMENVLTKLKIDLKIMGMIRACFGQRPEVVVE